MTAFSQSPVAPSFVQDPYAAYDRIRTDGPVQFWKEYNMLAAFSYATVSALMKDRRLGREIPPELATKPAPHTQAFYDVEAHSMLELEPPRHTRLRGLVLRAFTSRRIKTLQPDVTQLSNQLIDAFPDGPFDLLKAYATPIPIVIIARLLGVPEAMADQLLKWSNAMVAMYQANRSHAMELAAAQAAREFSDFIRSYVVQKRKAPADDLLTELIAAEEDGEKLSTDELVTTCILLLNAGHEATVHSIGNAVKTLLETQSNPQSLAPENIAATVEELIRFDPPLHMFTRYAYEEVDVAGHRLQRGDQIALLLGAANRDPGAWEDAHLFNPKRAIKTNMAFGAGRHFCVGAPLARLELQVALPILFERCPSLQLVRTPEYADTYHFHGLTQLMVRR